MGQSLNSGDAGWGAFGSLTWHTNYINSLESVEEVQQYIGRALKATDLEDAKQEALTYIGNGSPGNQSESESDSCQGS